METQTPHPHPRRTLARPQQFYPGWIAANGVAEAIGLGSTFVLGHAVAPYVEGLSDIGSTFAIMGVSVLLGVMLEGVLVGLLQGVVLKIRIPALHLSHWIWATAAGAGVAWFLGMIPSTYFALTSPPQTDAAVFEPGLLFTLLMAAALGALTGPILGIAQWVVLRRFVHRAWQWLIANALAWAVGMMIIFAGMDLVPWDGHPLARGAMIYTVCLCAGLAVGAVHGILLLRLTAPRTDAASHAIAEKSTHG